MFPKQAGFHQKARKIEGHEDAGHKDYISTGEICRGKKNVRPYTKETLHLENLTGRYSQRVVKLLFEEKGSCPGRRGRGQNTVLLRKDAMNPGEGS